MQQHSVLSLLLDREGWLSGEEMSHTLGVTRAAVWKQIDALRQEGWPIEAFPRRGYRLSGPPPFLSAPWLEKLLPENSLFQGKIQVFDRLDSTNTRLKALAAAGAPEGSVVLAGEQTAGRGTHGRTFASPKGQGLYLSVLLRPHVGLEQLLTLTARAALAVGDGIQAACGARPGIKWLNDLYLNGGKVCGILTELTLLGESGEPDCVVLGIGINLTQTAQDFQALGLEGIATSLAREGFSAEVHQLAFCVLASLEEMYRQFPGGLTDCLTRYRERCLTLGRQVSFQHQGRTLIGTATALTDQFALEVRCPDGSVYTLNSGSVTPL